MRQTQINKKPERRPLACVGNASTCSPWTSATLMSFEPNTCSGSCHEHAAFNRRHRGR